MMRFRHPLRIRTGVVVLGVLLAAAAAGAQFGRGRFNVRLATSDDYDGAFHFCRVWFRSAMGGDGGNWSVDFPRADINLSIRLAELTKTTVSQTRDRQPNHLLVRLTDDTLFQCPFTMATDVGTAGFSDLEVARLREYLLKGGFLWVDDFWGTRAWQEWSAQMRRVLPEYPIVDVPADHATRHMMFSFDEIPQVTSINFWRRSGGTTSERGSDSPHANFRMIADQRGRVMVLMTHNTDIGDSWEREGEDREFFLQFSSNGYALGVNVVLYALSH